MLFGYRAKPGGEVGLRPQGGAPPGAGGVAEPDPMCISLDVTVDPALVPPQRVQPQIVRGKEKNKISLKRKNIHKNINIFVKYE